MKVLSLFSGIGAFEKALDNLHIDYELVGYCEIDKYASKSYSAIHNVSESMNLGDITKIDGKALPKNIDLVCYGFPCQDISTAGKMRGLFNEDGSQTRSGLFFEALRIIEETQPRVAIAENVKNLVGKKFKEQFEIVLDSLNKAGYNNYWKVLNAKDYGIPQNRERVFIVSIRKDIDTGLFEFLEGFPLELRLKDMLEESVDEKFYLSQPMVQRLFDTTYESGKYENRVTKENGIVGTLCARDYKDPKCVELNPSIRVREATKKGYAEAVVGDSINFEQPNSKTRRGRVGRQVAQTLTTSPQQAVVTSDSFIGKHYQNFYNKNGYIPEMFNHYNESEITEIAPTQTCNCGSTASSASVLKMENLRIRKLTPLECWRLMGFDDEDFYKAEKVNSNTQLYKQAGNSIVVPVVEYITKALIDCGAFGCEPKQQKYRKDEGQLAFSDISSFERYINHYKKGEQELCAN